MKIRKTLKNECTVLQDKNKQTNSAVQSTHSDTPKQQLRSSGGMRPRLVTPRRVIRGETENSALQTGASVSCLLVAAMVNKIHQVSSRSPWTSTAMAFGPCASYLHSYYDRKTVAAQQLDTLPSHALPRLVREQRPELTSVVMQKNTTQSARAH